MEKSEYLIIGNNIVTKLPLEKEQLKGLENTNNRGHINKIDSGKEEIICRMDKGEKLTNYLNSVLWKRRFGKIQRRDIQKNI